ncbi:MAG: hypothetical protein EBV15_00725 [Bacteroidetes bacterium]|jgi:hypothetical protein|nr:hypothetical protein [Bacteroidota bacterium]
MKQIKKFSLIIGLLITSTAKADSPLTSTNFATAYNSEQIVMAAARARGKVTKQIMEYLIDETKPIGIKVAAINQLGWDFNGKNNAEIFIKFIQEKKAASDTISSFYIDRAESMTDSIVNYSISSFNIELLNADELLCYSYLMALDNYFTVDRAVELAEKAVQLKPDSYTFCIITALIQAQHISHTGANECEINKIIKSIKNDPTLKKDLNEQAIKIIYEYMDLYTCN